MAFLVLDRANGKVSELVTKRGGVDILCDAAGVGGDARSSFCDDLPCGDRIQTGRFRRARQGRLCLRKSTAVEQA